jgi:hypothetical protein
VVVEVLERAHKTIVGRYDARDGMGSWFRATSASRRTSSFNAATRAVRGRPDRGRGNHVTATRHRAPAGRIVEVLGDHMAPGMEIEVAVRSHDIPHVWPDAVMREAEQFAPEVPAQAAQGRFDLRDIPLVTIDGEDARDFDDAVFADHAGDTWRLIVAIADVSYYVKPGAALAASVCARQLGLFRSMSFRCRGCQRLVLDQSARGSFVHGLRDAIDGSGKISNTGFGSGYALARASPTKWRPCLWIKMPRGASTLTSCRT